MFPAEHHLKKMGVVICCYTGELSQGEAVLQPFRDIATPAIDFAGPIPFPMLQGLFDGLYPPGLQWYWNADFVIKLSDEAIALHLEHFAQSPTVHSAMHLYPTNGAAHQVGRNDTAWNYREANFAQVIVGVDPDPANQKAITNWSKAYWQALHPHSAGGAYVNMMMEEGEDRIRAAYGDNYMRLAQIKAKYDPHNLFHVNQNIKPAS
jgi:FAD/FMN-containing dehydrogenase